jgi:hypothetical protein
LAAGLRPRAFFSAAGVAAAAATTGAATTAGAAAAAGAAIFLVTFFTVLESEDMLFDLTGEAVAGISNAVMYTSTPQRVNRSQTQGEDVGLCECGQNEKN